MTVEVVLLGGGVDVVIAPSGSVEIVATTAIEVVSPPEGPAGPQGAAGAQDIGWGPLTGAFAPGEVLNTPPLPHAATYSALYAHTDSGVAAAQILTIEQKRAGAVIASVTFALAPGVHDLESSISSITAAPGDVLTLLMPNPADVQLTDFCVSLGSTP